MKIIINIDKLNESFDDIIDYIAKNLKQNEFNGDASTDDTYYSWRTE